MITLDQPHQIEAFKLLQVIARLKIEVSTGMGSRQPTLKIAKRYYNLKVSTKKQALELLEETKNKVLADPTQIWAILAKLRGSRVFIVCDVCTWQGDEFTAGRGRISNDEGWYCPKCKTDESGLQIVRII